MVKVRILVSSKPDNKATSTATIDVKKSGKVQRYNVTSPMDLQLEMGDQIKCIFGTAVALINPGSPAGAYFLTPNPPPNSDGKSLTVLTIDAKTTREIHRGSISVAPDIGNVIRATSDTTR